MTDLDIEEKTRRLAAHGSPGCDVDRIIELVWRIDQLADASQLTAALSLR
jgi:hypothetical protein